jgi:hypothetical protein
MNTPTPSDPPDPVDPAGRQPRGSRAGRRAGSLWPFPTQAAVVAVPLIALALVAALAVARAQADWPGPGSDNLVLVGVLVLSLLPVLLVLVDLVARRGGSIAFREVRIDFAGAVEPASTITIPRDTGFPGRQVTDSSRTEIIQTLRGHVGNEFVVVDLEEGDAWWETRLLILCAGAARFGRPGAIVFVATQRAPRRFQGWAPPADLLRALLRADPRYRTAYAKAQAAAAQWRLVPPPDPGVNGPPPAPAWMSPSVANYGYIAWEPEGKWTEPNEFTAEQLLANELVEFEPPEAGGITTARLKHLADSFLRTDAIDRQWSDDARMDALLASEAEYVAVTDRGQYVGLLSHAAGRTMILQALVREARGQRER